jgi:pyruvate dehydrogenase E1 component
MSEADVRRYSVITDGLPSQIPDVDAAETAEWLASLDQVIDNGGATRARYLMLRLLERSRERRIGVPALTATDYVNTIPTDQEPWFPGDEETEERIRAYIRWNAAVAVTRAQRPGVGVGGHIATYASSAHLYEVGFNHFFRGKSDPITGEPASGDQLFIQGHASPGIYARAFLEGRLSAESLDAFRQESLPGGLPSYPHPRLKPDFWEFPTVSMGLGPLNAIYQARFNRYLHNRGIADTSKSTVWAFLGDGEMDEPESLGAIGVAAREELDNLVFVVNCNLQRLDGPVRGNGKIIQELESFFRGAGWHVIKVIWGRAWDPLLAQDGDGVLVNQMNTTPDGQFQTYSVESGAYTREKFFGGDPRLRAMVEGYTDDQIRKLGRGGHDYRKVYSAYKAAVEHRGQPTVVLAHTIKGWSLGSSFEGRNSTHQMKKLTHGDLVVLRDRLRLPISDEQLAGELPPYFHPGAEHPDIAYMKERRAQLGGAVPRRLVRSTSLPAPDEKSLASFADLAAGSGKQEVATTMAFVRLLKDLVRDKGMGHRVVPIVPDEARTFGMDAMFPTAKIYSPHGQRYDAVDRELLLSYKESVTGQILHEGISEAGSMGSATAAGTSYSTHSEPMIPVYVFYSMFGFQRTADSIWAMTDAMGRGFLIGATAGRTTLNGEGLQHQDGHSPLYAASNPAVVSYDPAWAYEIATVVREGLRRMYEEPGLPGPRGELDADPNVVYYLTVYNEPYVQPARPAHVTDEMILRGLYVYSGPPSTEELGPESPVPVQIIASGVALPWAMKARGLLAADWGVAATVWSAPSFTELRREALACDAAALLGGPTVVPWVTRVLDPASAPGPVIAVSDWMRQVPDQITPWVPEPARWSSLGTDGFGRSDTRSALRRHFRVDAESIVCEVLRSLERRGEVPAGTAGKALQRYRIDDVRAVVTDATEGAGAT